MTSPRRSQDKPVESVALKITFRADKETTAKIKKGFPSARFRQETCEVKIEGELPGEVAEKAKILLDLVRKAT